MANSLMSGNARLLAKCVVIAFALCGGAVEAQKERESVRSGPDRDPSPGCGDFNYHYDRDRIGPIDYRVATEYTTALVENAHFTRSVESLRKGKGSTIGGDIAYTLFAFPNHPRALRAAAEYERLKGPDAVREMGFSTLCWFERALSYRASDPNVRIVVAAELIKRGQKAEARTHLEVAEKNAGGSAAIMYNLGLLYFDLGEYDRSLAFAKEAYSQGLDLPGLRQKLIKAGKWQDR